MSIRNIKSSEEFIKVAKALSLDVRMRIYELLHIKPHNINEIAEFLNIPLSTVTVNIQKLEEADLIISENVPGVRGMQKICSLKYDTLVFSMRPSSESAIIPNKKEIAMPIGQYVAFEAERPCGLAAKDKPIGKNDDIRNFYAPDHVQAQLIWLEKGYLEYHFPRDTPDDAIIQSLEFSAEMCSEAPGHNNKWPSDITVWINQVEIGTWTSPGDFGGKPGKLTPKWWPATATQYGLLKKWKIDEKGTYIDNEKISNITIHDIMLDNKPYISVKIGVKKDAKNVGGLNLFGENFGNHKQDLILQINYF
jgi:predicted transcriptional regulator